MISQTIKLIVSSYDFICSNIVVDCNNNASVGGAPRHLRVVVVCVSFREIVVRIFSTIAEN